VRVWRCSFWIAVVWLRDGSDNTCSTDKNQRNGLFSWEPEPLTRFRLIALDECCGPQRDVRPR
jgi:hypothetical protein